ncbi:MAG TPA: cell envelope integrity EipB family protein [Hyphomicrobiaceae bacterium]|jgi:hypothetical protein|nr:cell envelope integrity EipB family protein [Hyphomicrobiaceae bacterium]
MLPLVSGCGAHGRRFGATLALVVGLAWSTPPPALAEGPMLAPHRAVYDMELANTHGGSSLSAITGRIVYELTGSPCSGYSQNIRVVMQMINESGGATLTDQRLTTWEDASGKRYRFDSSEYRDDKLAEAAAGDAVRPDKSAGVKVELTKPAKKDVSLPDHIYFPVQHMMALVDAAKAGKTSLRANLYEGSEKGEKVYDTVSVIGRRWSPERERKLEPVKNAEVLDRLPAWPVSIAHFERSDSKEDALPAYEQTFLLFENGVSRRLYLDYGNFAISGNLKEISFLPLEKCADRPR